MKLPSGTKALLITTGVAAVVMLLVLLGSQGILWTDPAEAVAPSKQRPSHSHNHEGLTWPPTPRGIGNVVVHSDAKKDENERAIKKARRDRLGQKAERVIPGLGNRFTSVTVIDREDKIDSEDRGGKKQKNTDRVVSQLVLFSHDRNATVEVGFDAKENMEAVTFTPASEYQPEVTDEEIKDAEKLARKHFSSQGKRIAGLRAYGILAYKPEGNGFYSDRVLYVSFHKDDDAPPQLMAWVDLTNQRILQAREEL